MIEEHDVLVLEGFVDFYLGDELGEGECTFCLALFFFKVYFATIFIAIIFLVSRF